MDILIFIHNRLMIKEIMRRYVGDRIKSVEPAFMKGRIYKLGGINHLVTYPVCKSICYGALYTIEYDSVVYKMLDGYHGCTKYLYGFNHAYDLSHREKISVRPIRFESVESFLKSNYSVLDYIEAECYLMNPPVTGRRMDRHNVYNFASDFLTAFK